MSGRRDYGPLVEAAMRRDMERIMEVLPTVTEQDYFDTISLLIAQLKKNPEVNIILHAIKDRVCILSSERLYELFEIAVQKRMANYIDTILDCENFDKNQPELLLGIHSLDQLQYLMRKGIPFPTDQQEKNDMLTNSIRVCSPKLTEFLIEQGAKSTDTRIIFYALNFRCDAIIPFLLQAGAEIDIEYIRFAIANNLTACLKQLISPLVNERYKIQLLNAHNILKNLPSAERSQFLDNLLAPLVDIIDEYNLQRNREATAERREKALKAIAEGDEKRRIALEEYKTKETKEEIDPERKMVQNTCTDNSQNSLLGDELKDTDEIVVFYLGSQNKGEAFSSPKGECYLKSELRDYLNSLDPDDTVYEWLGPPSPFGIPGNPPRPDRTKPVYKLPWTGTWIKGEILEKVLYEQGTVALELEPIKMSIGSTFAVSALHGQWGGHWRKVGNNAEYVESGNAVPDDRELVYGFSIKNGFF